MMALWDFAQATGRQVTVPEGLAAFVPDVTGQIVTPEVCSGGGFAGASRPAPMRTLWIVLFTFTGRNVLAGRTVSS